MEYFSVGVAIIVILGGLVALFKYIRKSEYAMSDKADIEVIIDNKVKAVASDVESFKRTVYNKLDQHTLKSSNNSDRIIVIETQLIESASRFEVIINTIKDENKEVKAEIKELTRTVNKLISRG